MSSKKTLSMAIAATIAASGRRWAQDATDTPGLGTPLSEEDLAGLSTTVFPDGEGLPPGGGTVQDGKVVYQDQCAICHGDKGEGDEQFSVPALASDGKPDHGFKWSTGHAWPCATSIFDYVRVAMPMFDPKGLSDEDVYAVTAYVLHLNGFLPEDGEVTQESLPKVKMPSQDYFTSKWEKEESGYE